ncbi:unnamed protein product [Timema podura]|uniref:Laminin G domain-containing protein n=1 Tax=Timema podura TaxID=61482 RepID=A0ABN7NM58_TIMPD|nr:unnamed protein product [Timema podura]
MAPKGVHDWRKLVNTALEVVDEYREFEFSRPRCAMFCLSPRNKATQMKIKSEKTKILSVICLGRRDVTHPSPDWAFADDLPSIMELFIDYPLGSQLRCGFRENSLDNLSGGYRLRNEQEGSLVVDNGPVLTKRAPGHLRQLNTNTGLYIGGMDNIKHSSMDKYAGGLVGCISDLVLDTDYHVKLVQMSTAGRNIKHCG